MNTEEQLRQKFGRLVPEAPDRILEPGAVETRGRAVRRRRAVTSIAGAALVAAVLVPLALRGGTTASTGPTTASTVEPDPLSTNPCPARLTSDYSADPLPTDLASVRVCDLPDTADFARTKAPSDALVTALPGFVTALERLPEADPAACISTTPAPATSAMVFTAVDGTIAILPVMACVNAEVAGSLKEDGAIHQAFLERLAQQRKALDSPSLTTFVVGNPCTQNPTAMIHDPSVERLTGATICHARAAEGGQQDSPKRWSAASDSDLALLQDAWSASAEQDDLVGCTQELGKDRIMLMTEFGDTVVYSFDGCPTSAGGDGALSRLVLDGAARNQLGLPG
jgi:hypothetical protein